MFQQVVPQMVRVSTPFIPTVPFAANEAVRVVPQIGAPDILRFANPFVTPLGVQETLRFAHPYLANEILRLACAGAVPATDLYRLTGLAHPLGAACMDPLNAAWVPAMCGTMMCDPLTGQTVHTAQGIASGQVPTGIACPAPFPPAANLGVNPYLPIRLSL